MADLVQQVTSIGLHASESVASQALGQRGEDKYGRKFRYVKAGGTALVEGNLLQSPAHVTDFTGMAVAVAAAVGATQVTVTLGSTAATKDQFAGGELVVSEAAGIGQVFKIVGNTAASASASCVVYLEEPIRTALTTSSKATLHLNDYNGVIVSPTTRTGKTVGVAIFAIPASKYGWIQTGGPSAALSDATVPVLGGGVSPSTTTAGCVTKAVTLLERIGTAPVLGVSAKVSPIFLEID
jgi:hypothetical protein